MTGITTARSVAKKLKQEAQARTLTRLLGGRPIGGTVESSLALGVLQKHFVRWAVEIQSTGNAMEDSDEEIEAMENQYKFGHFIRQVRQCIL
eukprot:SAG31_NODE_480_length_15108_cov_56.073423_4_plen_92_part_00